MKVYDPRNVRMYVDGAAVLVPETASPVWTNANASIAVEHVDLDAIHALVEEMRVKRIATRIDAPSDVIAKLERTLSQLTARGEGLALLGGMVRPEGLPIDRDDTIPAATIRVHYSDGRAELVLLERR